MRAMGVGRGVPHQMDCRFVQKLEESERLQELQLLLSFSRDIFQWYSRKIIKYLISILFGGILL
jgi:hypothetical protein